MDLLAKLRAQLGAWAKTATMEELGALPSKIFNDRVEKAPVGRLLRKMRTEMGPADGKMVREELKGIELDSPEFLKKRDELCRRHGWCRRQVGAALRQGQGPRQKSAAGKD